MARPAVAAALEVVDVECLRGDALIFEHLSFGVPAGHVLQILGANGSGKTSLLRMLSGLAPPDSGEIRWQGEPTTTSPRWREELLYQGIAGGFSANLTVTENLEYGQALAARGALMRVSEALDRVGLGRYGDTFTGRLSSGQRQRAALARLVLIPARAWLLDEPLTALDRDGKKLLEGMLRAHTEGGGIALVATHQGLEVPASCLHTLDLDTRTVC
ncbi:MAG: cytochrome c biogenesis heme-transporting ATPase CcmA [Gammaproteobacteria bacterium]|nr:cytochrome c biogenesis heme-transporting ATPase CcmA [Gammaproteobacteria bacterium]